MFTVIFHVVLCMADVHTTNKQHVHSVPQCRALTGLKIYIHDRTCVNRYINNIILLKVLHSIDTKTGISFATCENIRNPPL